MADTTKPAVRQYSAWWNEERSFVDFLVTWIVSLFVSFPRFRPSSPSLAGTENACVDHAARLRKPLDAMISMGRKTQTTGFYKWANAIGQDIVEATVQIPRNDAVVLEQWGIDRSTVQLPTNTTIPIHVTFPVGLLPDTMEVPNEDTRNEAGCLVLQGEDAQTMLQHLPNGTPMVVFVHGGGLTVGSSRMEDCVDILNRLDAYELKNVVHVAIQYSLAPEFPFPTPVLEVYSALAFLLERFSSVSLVGISAGGLLALSTSWQLFRDNNPRQNKLRSIVALCPMVDPAADSLSYYQHAKTLAAPAHWLRWSWRQYLELPEPEDADCVRPATDPCTLLSIGSNQMAWLSCSWYKSTQLRRLVQPTIDLPTKALQQGDGPQIVISTNSADPLHSEGVALVEHLRAVGANHVTHLDHRGSHFFGTMLDKRGLEDLLQAFRHCVWSVDNNTAPTAPIS